MIMNIYDVSGHTVFWIRHPPADDHCSLINILVRIGRGRRKLNWFDVLDRIIQGQYGHIINLKSISDGFKCDEIKLMQEYY